MKLLKRVINFFKYTLTSSVFSILLFGWVFAQDQMYSAFLPSKIYIIHWDITSPELAWNVTFSSSKSIDKSFIKILLSFVIAISVTMIIWNGVKYIIEIGNWKDWKDLYKNLIYIVVWILVAIFSVVIVNLMQSIDGTLDEQLRVQDTKKIVN